MSVNERCPLFLSTIQRFFLKGICTNFVWSSDFCPFFGSVRYSGCSLIRGFTLVSPDENGGNGGRCKQETALVEASTDDEGSSIITANNNSINLSLYPRRQFDILKYSKYRHS